MEWACETGKQGTTADLGGRLPDPPGHGAHYHLAVPEVTTRVEWDRYDTAIVTVAAIATIFVHPVRTMLKHPFWLDEAWVAVLTRAPLTRLPQLELERAVRLRRVVEVGTRLGSAARSARRARVLRADRRGRLRVHVFAELAAAVERTLRRDRCRRSVDDAGSASHSFATISSSTRATRSVRSRCSALGARTERTASRRSLVWFGVAGVATVPFSSTALFVSVALFAGLLVSALLARERERAIEILVVGGVTGVALAAYFVAAVAPNLNPKLRAYWASQYLTGSPQHMFIRRGTSWRDSAPTSRCRRWCSSCCSCSVWSCSCASAPRAVADRDAVSVGRDGGDRSAAALPVPRPTHVAVPLGVVALRGRAGRGRARRRGAAPAARARRRDRNGRGGGGRPCARGAVHGRDPSGYIRSAQHPAEDVRSETFAVAAQRRAARRGARQRVGELRLLLLLAARSHDVPQRPLRARDSAPRLPASTRSTFRRARTRTCATACVKRWNDGAGPGPAAACTSSART